MTKETEVVEEPQQVEAVAEQQPKEVEEAPKRDVNHNWREANEVMRLQKQRIDELEARLNQSKPKEDDSDEFDQLDQEDYLKVSTARQLAQKYAQKEAEKIAKKVVQEYAQQQAVTHDEARMRSKYDDYDYVMENFAIPMIKNDPALAYKIQTSKNPAEVAYKLGKTSDEFEEVMKQKTSPKAEKILKNTSRPTSSAAVGNLKSQADDFSKLSKQEIWQMSQDYAKRA